MCKKVRFTLSKRVLDQLWVLFDHGYPCLMRFLRLFTDHPREIGETYTSHAVSALKIALKFAIAAPMQVIHAIFPFIKPPFGSDTTSMKTFLRKMSPKARKRAKTSSCCDGQQCRSNVS